MGFSSTCKWTLGLDRVISSRKAETDEMEGSGSELSEDEDGISRRATMSCRGYGCSFYIRKFTKYVESRKTTEHPDWRLTGGRANEPGPVWREIRMHVCIADFLASRRSVPGAVPWLLARKRPSSITPGLYIRESLNAWASATFIKRDDRVSPKTIHSFFVRCLRRMEKEKGRLITYLTLGIHVSAEGWKACLNLYSGCSQILRLRDFHCFFFFFFFLVFFWWNFF